MGPPASVANPLRKHHPPVPPPTTGRPAGRQGVSLTRPLVQQQARNIRELSVIPDVSVVELRSGRTPTPGRPPAAPWS